MRLPVSDRAFATMQRRNARLGYEELERCPVCSMPKCANYHCEFCNPPAPRPREPDNLWDSWSPPIKIIVASAVVIYFGGGFLAGILMIIGWKP